MASPASTPPPPEAFEPASWRHARLPLAALGAALALYFVIAAVTKTDALEWFGSPWGLGDEVVVEHESAQTAPAVVSPARERVAVSSSRPDPRARDSRRPTPSRAAPARTARTDGRGARPAPPRGGAPGRTPAPGKAAAKPAAAPPGPSSSHDTQPESAVTVTPPALPPVQVTPPDTPDPPPLPVEPPQLPALPTLPVTPPSAPPLDVPALP